MLLRGTDIKITIIPSDRKSYSFKVLTNGAVEFRIPRHMSVWDIESAMEKHRDWIIRAVQQQNTRFLDSFSDGATVPVLGKPIRLETAPDGKIYLEGDVLYLPKENRPELLKEIYRKMAKEYLPERFRTLAHAQGFDYGSVRITSAKSRWGSCSSRKTINFSLRVMMLPPECIHYIMVHELCHLRHMDHSPAFYQEVAALLPDYKEREERIRQANVLLLD